MYVSSHVCVWMSPCHGTRLFSPSVLLEAQSLAHQIQLPVSFWRISILYVPSLHKSAEVTESHDRVHLF